MKSRDYLLKVAEFYCSKRETSRANLSRYLQRKCREKDIDLSMAKPWIEEILDACEESRMVDDKRYSELIIRDFTSRGKGRLYIQRKLKEKGIHKDTAQAPNDEQAELEHALKLANKVLPNIQAKVDDPFKLRQKLMMKLSSSGFTLDICRKAIYELLKPV